MSEISKALAEFQAELPDVSKGSTNPAFKSKYADLADITKAVFPVLTKHGLTFTAAPDVTEHGPVLRFQLRHVSGESIDGAFPLPTEGTAQQYGSWITYGRRYALSAVTGIAPDADDDGNQASQLTARTQKRDYLAEFIGKLNAAKTLGELQHVWDNTSGPRTDPRVVAAKDARKVALKDVPETTDEWAPVAPVEP